MRTEQMTIRQQMDDQAAPQGLLREKAEVRRLCREAKASAKVAEDVVWLAREVFRPVNGRIFPVAPDGKTVLRARDSENVLTAAEWTQAKWRRQGRCRPETRPSWNCRCRIRSGGSIGI